jgi:hypothetical protein
MDGRGGGEEEQKHHWFFSSHLYIIEAAVAVKKVWKSIIYHQIKKKIYIKVESNEIFVVPRLHKVVVDTCHHLCDPWTMYRFQEQWFQWWWFST